MKKQRRNIIKIAFFISIITIIGCDKKEEIIEFPFDAIENKIKLNRSEPFKLDLVDVVPFVWDSLYIFKPYTSIAKINDDIGYEWKEAHKTHINDDDGINLLVFTEKEKVVKYIKWPRNKGDFTRINPLNNPYSRKKSMFILKKEKTGNQDWWFFYELE
ncbi:hypothetical protein [Gelidibacter japonicus]|uniref:hypothetical protein n=1 Tax=Gelidibacter japonicus TaxID=1962232 RepID=UPI003A8EB9C8